MSNTCPPIRDFERLAGDVLRAVAIAIAVLLTAAACVPRDESTNGAAAQADAAVDEADAAVDETEGIGDTVGQPSGDDPGDEENSAADADTTPTPTAVPIPTPDLSGRPVGAALLRDARPAQPPDNAAAASPTAEQSPALAESDAGSATPAPSPTPTTEPTSTPEPTSGPAPTPVGEAGLGALRTPTGVIAAIVGGAEGAWEVVSPCNNTVTVSAGELLARPVVLLDPGHGGSETGAVGPGGLTEQELNLNVAKRLEAWLVARDIPVLLTRERDYRMALRARTALANAIRPTIFVSIHHNGGSTIDLDTPPTEVFYQEFSEDSKRLAGVMYEELERAMAPVADSWRGTPFEGAQPRFTPEGETLYGILRRSEVPAVITEPFYLDNEHGEGLANDPAVLAIETEALGAGIQRYLTTGDAGSGFVEGDQFTLGSSSGGTDGCVDPSLE